MPVDLQSFRRTSPKHQTKAVEVEQLAEVMFKGNKEEAVLHVRGLGSNEIYMAREQMQKNSPLNLLSSAIKAASQSEITEAFKRILGNDEEANAIDYTYRFYIVMAGVIDPDTGKKIFDYEDVSKLAEFWPATFILLSNEIVKLSGEGPDLGEG